MPEDLVKIRVELSELDLGVSGEGLWAKPLGNNLYEVHNSPWHTLEINYMDIVQAIAPNEDSRPNVVEVVRRGGHRSIHVMFLEANSEQKTEILAGANALGATYEGRDGTLYAFDLKPDVNFDSVADYLEQFEATNLIGVRYAPQPQPAGSGETVN